MRIDVLFAELGCILSHIGMIPVLEPVWHACCQIVLHLFPVIEYCSKFGGVS